MRDIDLRGWPKISRQLRSKSIDWNFTNKRLIQSHIFGSCYSLFRCSFLSGDDEIRIIISIHVFFEQWDAICSVKLVNKCSNHGVSFAYGWRKTKKTLQNKQPKLCLPPAIIFSTRVGVCCHFPPKPRCFFLHGRKSMGETPSYNKVFGPTL